MQPNCLAQSSEMALHGTCFMALAFAQQSPVAVCAVSIQVDAINSGRGIYRRRNPVRVSLRQRNLYSICGCPWWTNRAASDGCLLVLKRT
jgi:hypothetical protein